MSCLFARIANILLILTTACGAVTINLDTRVKNENDIRHDLEVIASGQIALHMADEINHGNPELEEHCRINLDETNRTLNILCENFHKDDNLNIMGPDEPEDIQDSIATVKNDLGAMWEYETAMPNPMLDLAQDADLGLDAQELEDPEYLDTILRLRINWTVQVPGNIIETNADLQEKNTATFNLKPGDTRETLKVISRQKKSSGCN